MNRRKLFLRITAIAFSAMLVSTYVIYRGSTASPSTDWPSVEAAAAPSDTVLPGSKSAEVFPPPPPFERGTAKKTEPKPRPVMGGSKSARIADPTDLQFSPPAPPPPPPASPK